MPLDMNSRVHQGQHIAGYISVAVRFLGVLCFICGVNSDDASDFQKHLPAHLVWAVSGKEADLPCDVTPPSPKDSINMVLWFKDSIGIPLYSLDARGGDLGKASHWAIHDDLGMRTYFQVPGMTQTARLKIYSVKPDDEGVFRCRVDFVNSPTRNFRVNLTIVVPPSEPTIYDDKGKEITGVAGPFLEGYDLALTCLVKGGRPLPRVIWFLGTSILDQESESSSSGFTRNRLYIKVVTRSLLNEHLRCEATSSELTDPVVKNVSLDIYLKPRTVNITTLPGPLSAGKTHQLQCMTTGSAPPARVTWLLDGESIRDAVTSAAEMPNSTTSVLTFRPRAGDNGKELACRAENKRFLGGMLEHRRRLDVTYPPTVTVQLESDIDLSALKEGDDVLLSCQVRANPQPDPKTVTWYHGQDQLLEHNESKGVLPAGQRLMLRELVKESAGDYACAAANSEGETRSRIVHMRVQYAPRCREGFESRRLGAIRHETMEIKCEVRADPREDVKFSWTYNKSRDVLPVHGSRLVNLGLVSLLRFTPGTEEDYGTLACWASNSIGRQMQPCLFHIVLAKTPQPPEDCVLRNGSSGGLEVHCVAGFDGDLPQHFVMEVSESPEYADLAPQSPDASVAMNDMGTRQRAPGPPLLNLFAAEEPVFWVNNLQPGRDYELAVYAVNAKGRSEPPVVIPRVRIHNGVQHLTKTDSIEPSTTTIHPMTVALGSLVAAAVLIMGGIFITALLVICRRRAATPQQEQDDKPRPNVYSEAPAPLSPATVFSVPNHVPRAYSKGSRVRFRTEAIEIQARRSIYSEDDDKINRTNNEPDLIVSRAEVILSPATPQQRSS